MLALLGCTEAPGTVIDDIADDDRSPSAANPSDPYDPSEVNPPGGPIEADSEICDGWDNDRDGEVDEGTGGGTCLLADGIKGKEFCVGGDLHCWECVPGEIREEPCGCGVSRVDVCGADGLWRTGPCDGCQAVDEPCGACTPGEETLRRCDDCDGEDCGATCVAALWRCNDECAWEQIEACTAIESQCNADQRHTESCGRCGERLVTCDGCLWVSGPCGGEGLCTPGEIRPAPCPTTCEEGFTAKIVCNNTCEWETTGSCEGCEIGKVVISDVPCAPGHNKCGTAKEEAVCEWFQTDHTCGGQQQLAQGRWSRRLLSPCNLQCVPGEYQAYGCMVGQGVPGQRVIKCLDDCTWDAEPTDCLGVLPLGPGGPGEIPGNGICVPQIEVRETLTCEAGTCNGQYQGAYEVLYICNSQGSGWDDKIVENNCPVCVPGRTSVRNCVLEDGRCGRESVACDPASCTWTADGPCEPRATACVPDTVVTKEVSCGGDTCGATYTVTRTCTANGCGYTESADRAACPECTPGQPDVQPCQTQDKRCGTQQRSCSESCQWGDWETCVALPDSCREGETREVSCARCQQQGLMLEQCVDCSWQAVGECDVPAFCEPGVMETVGLCRPGVPQCGEKKRVCTERCEWKELSCEPCG